MGFTVEGSTDVMVADLESGFAGTAAVAEQPSATWWRTMADLWGIGPDRAHGWRGIVNRIALPGGFGTATTGTNATGAGLAVVDGKWVGLFEIIVRADNRRRGVGSDLAQSLMAWGRDTGASAAFLQVVADNGPAIGMYEELGFVKAYTYWYRRAPRTA
ncbi:MAG: GNAT family N-acetyltransferase [Actinomycetia bacterium]|nr:GNAT family N-acetyltransferase [Actinomycetes bacterium]